MEEVAGIATQVVGRLAGDALEEFRAVATRYEALHVNPGVFSQAETIDIIREYWTALGRILTDFGVDPAAEWNVSPVTGQVTAEV